MNLLEFLSSLKKNWPTVAFWFSMVLVVVNFFIFFLARKLQNDQLLLLSLMNIGVCKLSAIIWYYKSEDNPKK